MMLERGVFYLRDRSPSRLALAVTEAMEKVLSQIIHLPKNLQTDKGSEFYNSIFLLCVRTDAITILFCVS
jgi:hypothetical protein